MYYYSLFTNYDHQSKHFYRLLCVTFSDTLATFLKRNRLFIGSFTRYSSNHAIFKATKNLPTAECVFVHAEPFRLLNFHIFPTVKHPSSTFISFLDENLFDMFAS